MTKIQHLTEEQQKAANPEYSAWVQANAGTGKTKLLVGRLLRIIFRTNERLKHGILCLTYTKAGAGEMRNRITKALKEWSLASDDVLREMLWDVVPNPPASDKDLIKARQIFYEFIDNPDILKVKTIHSFCEEILRRYPSEAGLSPSWEVMLDSTKSVLEDEAFQRLFINADDNVKSAFDYIMGAITEDGFNALKDDVLKLYQSMLEVDNLDKYHELFVETIRKKLDYDENKNYDYDEAELRNILDKCNQVPNPKHTKFTDYREALAGFLNGTKTYEEYEKKCLQNINKPTMKPIPTLETHYDFLHGELDRVYQRYIFCAKQTLFNDTLAVFDLTRGFAIEYDKLKKQQNLLDFDDLILYTDRLFSNPETMGWVLSQMDISLSHLLVDEAQDTGTKQWNILNKLTEDFFTDGETSECPRTILVVGDTKQAIFGFQDANPKTFDESRRIFFERLLNNARSIDPDTNLTLSFRSAKPILQAVDTFFGNEIVKSVTNFENNNHKCFNENVKGNVEIYKVARKDTEKGENAEIVKTAYTKTICNKIKELIDSGKYKASDIMVLVRNRKPWAPKITARLHKLGVPIAGADRINLPTFPVIVDLLNLVRFCIDNDDDYSLACVLKSPMFGLNESQIYDICKPCNDEWKKLKETDKYVKKPAIYPYVKQLHPEVSVILEDFTKRIATSGPYTFFSYVLNTHNNREKMVAALGHQILEPLEEFMTLCLAYERTHPGSIKHFLKWFITGASEIKRELGEKSINGVRILTIHGSKGLEAPVVFLIDTIKKPNDKERIFNIFDTNNQKTDFWFWVRSTKYFHRIPNIQDVYTAKHQLELEEGYRLFYVGMTRPQKELYVYGYTSYDPDKNLTQWHTLLWNILSQSDEPFVQKLEDKIRISNEDR